jgi:mannitol/fructose-specific phosphotransferase system IIA component (Ntr-type)
MQLISLLDPKLIYFDEHSETKVDALKILVERICKKYQLPDCCENLSNLLKKREEESSTTYPTGLAIPHIRKDNFNDTVIGVCIPRKPIFDNGQQVKIIFLIITDKTSSKLYLNVVAAVMLMSKDEAVMKQILSQSDGHDVFNILKKENYSVKEDLTIKDIMTPNPFTIRETATIKELSAIIFKHNIKSLPVVNEQNDFIGEVNILNYLKIGVPDHLMMMTNLKFLHSYEPFENLFEHEEKVLIKDIMSPPELTLYPDNSIIEAVFKMIQNKKLFFTVTENRKVVGILTAMDIFRKVVKS